MGYSVTFRKTGERKEYGYGRRFRCRRHSAGTHALLYPTVQLGDLYVRGDITDAFAIGSLFVPEVKLHACFRPTTPSPFACQLLFCDIPDPPALHNILTI